MFTGMCNELCAELALDICINMQRTICSFFAQIVQTMYIHTVSYVSQ